MAAPRLSLPGSRCTGRSSRTPSKRSLGGGLLQAGDVLCRRPPWFCHPSRCKMAPGRPTSRWSAGGLAARGERTPQVGLGKQNGKRRTWRPNHHQAFLGSVREGQGFAFRRKLKIQQSYKKLLWKVKKAPVSQESQFTDHYPDHLKHLYLAEEERLRKQQRKVGLPLSEEQADQTVSEAGDNTEHTLSEQSGVYQPQPEQLSTVNSVTSPKKKKKKTSNQKAQEEYQQVQAKRAAKKFEFEMRKQEREEAQRRYKKKKMEAFKILSKKTKKGQPNLNLQMEYLLQKIQENS
ncbi:thyroid transcription factor 1-associated protein 26 [Meriones unguiculatus]|uniref:thyroid transcription factor 1-associated protein 26 n=1 Tax=Meriones unguiculatus TaxID=10047 RepID=UPI00293F73D9|nr:thyroid transcription factor 1-associated protein 26 [Meriones unguiculatus]